MNRGRCDRLMRSDAFFLRSEKKIKIFVKISLLFVVVWLNASIKCSVSSIRGLEESLFQENARLSSFLFVEARRKWSQLSSVLRWSVKDKSQQSFSWSSFAFVRLLKCFQGCKSYANISYVLLVLLVVQGVINGLRILLIRAGVELNPGPSGASACIRVLSQNCRGLTECRKTSQLIKTIYKKAAGKSQPISCFQETHQINRFVLDNLFDGSYVVDDGERNQRGDSILIPEKYKIYDSVISGLGRWAIVAVQEKSTDLAELLVVANIYAPNCHRDSKTMFQDFFHQLDSFTERLDEQSKAFELVVTGDFNVVLDPIRGSLNRNSLASERGLAAYINQAFGSRAAIEIKVRNQQLNSFTWRRGNCWSQLDYMFVSPLLAAKVDKAEIKWHAFGANFDHALLDVQFSGLARAERGRSFPKLYNTDIAVESDRTWLRGHMDQFMQQIPPHWDPHMRLEFIKSMLRTKTLELRVMNKRTCSSEVIKRSLNEHINKPIFTREDKDNIEALRLELARIEEQEAETLRIRAGVKWRETGEKSTRFFLSRFRARTNAATMNLLRAGGSVITGTGNFVKFVRIFYSNLYASQEPAKEQDIPFADEFFSNCPRLDRAQKEALARPMNIVELKAALATCKDSAPGLDGIPYSFYKAFPDPLLKLLMDLWNFAVQTGEMANSHRRSCLTLLPKKGKDLTMITNWRPISLSACDLKIVTKAYANRLKAVLPDILCESQAAYVPGRDISFNNRLLNLAKEYARRSNADFCVVSLDAKKAFDSVSHGYLAQLLSAYDFPVEFIGVFNTLYANLESVAQVNCHLSNPFPIKNGVKQGDALSCGLFVLAMDPLIRNIIKNDSIEGMLIPTSQHDLEEIKVLAYADDVSIVCRNGNLQPIFDEYERLTNISGLALNADKTEVFNLTQSQAAHNGIRYLGTLHNIGRIDKIIICGMCTAGTEAIEYQHNVLNRIEIMEGQVSRWGRRQLTINCRMILAKTFLLSQIVFPAQAMMIGNKEIKTIERLIYAFVNGARNLYGPEHIARKYLKAGRDEGGINGIDVQSFITAIALRQFAKAEQLHRVLGNLQRSVVTPKDSIGSKAIQQLKAGVLGFMRAHPLPDIHDLETISSAP